MKNFYPTLFQTTLKKLLKSSLICLCISQTSLAGDYNKAIDTSVKAILKVQPVKKATKRIKKLIRIKTGLTKTQTTVITVVGQGALSGKVSTKPLKNFGTKALGGRLRIDVEYNWKNNSSSSGAVLTWPF